MHQKYYKQVEHFLSFGDLDNRERPGSRAGIHASATSIGEMQGGR
jgi:hypothetical protein